MCSHNISDLLSFPVNSLLCFWCSPCEVNMGVVMNENKQSVRILSDFLHKGFHLGVDVGVQTHHVFVSFLVCGDAFFNPQVYEHSCVQDYNTS